jgi:hypothetical protein
MRKRTPVDLLRPHTGEEMKAWKVGKAVGNVRNVGPELCTEWSGPSDLLFGLRGNSQNPDNNYLANPSVLSLK